MSSFFRQLCLFVAFTLSFFNVCCIADQFLSSWQGQLASVINSATILDVSLPGTHDTLTYDLSLLPSIGAIDNQDFLSELLHTIEELALILPAVDVLDDWIRLQSQTQRLNITEQLNNGIRFLDFRNMWTSVDLVDYDWYGLHFLQTNQRAIYYLQEIRAWLDAHPTEWIVMWISKHGNPTNVGTNQYPSVSVSTKQAWWAQITQLFSGLLVDTAAFPVNTTSIGTLLAHGQRVLLITSDWVEFTNSSNLALNAATALDNELLAESVVGTDEPNLVSYFENSLASVMATNKRNNVFTLMSLAGVPKGNQGLESFLLTFFPLTKTSDEEKCASAFSIPNMSKYCPMRLIDCGYINNYYDQYAFEAGLRSNSMPNAIYLDGVDEGGLIHIGVGDSDTRGYAYADTILLININRVCSTKPQTQCAQLQKLVYDRREQHPLQLWDDTNGRNSNWPAITLLNYSLPTFPPVQASATSVDASAAGLTVPTLYSIFLACVFMGFQFLF